MPNDSLTSVALDLHDIAYLVAGGEIDMPDFGIRPLGVYMSNDKLFAFNGCLRPVLVLKTGLCSGHYQQQCKQKPLIPLYSTQRVPRNGNAVNVRPLEHTRKDSTRNTRD